MTKKFVIEDAVVFATTGIGLGLTQLVNAGSHSLKPTESSSVSVATGQAGNQQGNSMDGQHDGPGGGMMGLWGISTATLAQELDAEESKLNEALQSIQQSQGPGGAPNQGKPFGNGTGQAAEGGQGQPPAILPGESGSGSRDSGIAEALAQAPGLDEPTVTTTIQEVRAEADKEVLDQAISGGRLTQAEADAVTKATTAGIAEIHDADSGPR